MRIVQSGLVLVGLLGLGLLALQMILPGSRSAEPAGSPPRATPALPAVATLTSQREQDWTFGIDEVTLSQQLNDLPAGQLAVQTPLGAAHLQDLAVELRESQIRAHGVAEAGWVRARVNLAASASVQAGRVLVHVTEARANGFALPDAASHRLEIQLQDLLDRSVQDNHVLVRSVSVADGRLVLSGTRP